MKIQHTSFENIPENAFGIVIQGVDLCNDDQENQWINGITQFLKDKDICDPNGNIDDIWSNIYTTVSKGGRRDLIFQGEPSKFNVNRFAIIRLQMRNCSWIEDWLVNCAGHYGVPKRGPHANLL